MEMKAQSQVRRQFLCSCRTVIVAIAIENHQMNTGNNKLMWICAPLSTLLLLPCQCSAGTERCTPVLPVFGNTSPELHVPTPCTFTCQEYAWAWGWGKWESRAGHAKYLSFLLAWSPKILGLARQEWPNSLCSSDQECQTQRDSWARESLLAMPPFSGLNLSSSVAAQQQITQTGAHN